eukprot:TRINITY_DN18890_c0_g1_i1.p1 TRINITY_DN18890_c0_g1~~TRINITY_DN18890_c0_g1_i1.p1  ORF type:complete len:309 (+),score=54.97 TRINITY_DN18890_c0_g1_i1:116-1042(+)
MAALQDDSFAVAALGRQQDSSKPSQPAYSFGTGQRDVARNKVYMSVKHDKKKAILNSPGPVYSVPSTVGDAPRFGFGTDDQRKHDKAKYPDSSVDLTGATVDSQKVKFPTTPRVHFGTESRMNTKNAEILRAHPGLGLGMESPGALEYSPDETKITGVAPQYSFGPKAGVESQGQKPCVRLTLPLTSVPRHVGPGSHQQPSALGEQPTSARPSAPSWGFGSASKDSARKNADRRLLDSDPHFSSLGKQVVSSARSAPQCGFGTSTREHTARTQLMISAGDVGPIAKMEKLKFHCELPPPQKHIPKPGI